MKNIFYIMISKILSSVEDFQKQIVDGTLKVCLLRPNSKISKEGWASFASLSDLQDVRNAQDNLGISLTGGEFPGDKILTCIDIDGDKREVNGQNIEQFSKDLMYNIITEAFDEEEIKYMAIRSSSGGYHIYIYTLNKSGRYDSTVGLYYPKETKNFPQKTQMYLSANKTTFENLKEDNFPRECIEIWCEKRYMVAPGSDIFTTDGEYVGTTTLLEDGVQKFGDIGLFKDNLNEFIRLKLLEYGFIENEKLNYKIQKNFSFEDPLTEHDLREFDIRLIGDILVKYFPKIPGQKHTCTLALGGYLYRKKVSEKSIRQIADYVINNSKDDLFDNKAAFVGTLLHDTETNDDSRYNTGLPTVEDIFSPYIPKDILGKRLHLCTNPLLHTFWPNGKYAAIYNEITLYFNQNYINKNIMTTSITKDGEVTEKVKQNFRIEHCINKINRIIDISDPDDLSPWERSVQLFFTSKEFIGTSSKTYQNSNELFKEYRKLPGAYTDQAKGIIEAIYREFETIGLIEEIESSTKPGIYYSKQDKKLKQYVFNGTNIVEKLPEKPTKEQLTKSLTLLSKINDVYPWQDGKFGYLIKMSLTMPYTDVFKNHFGKHHPCFILHGEAGTLKTTAGELILNLFNPNLSKEGDNIASGAELLSEYRFGRIMDASTYPLIVNETEYLFSHAKFRNLIKDSVTGYLIRRPGGDKSKGYYSHRSAIYTMNALPNTAEDPAFLRRFIPLEFERSERGDIPEVQEKFQFLNKDGIENYEFKNLHYIGDFIFSLLSENIQVFKLSLNDIQEFLIKKMETYTNMDLSFLKKSPDDFIYIDRSEQENNTLNQLLSILRKPYLQSKAKFIKDSSDISIIKKLITTNNDYSYIHFINNDFILIDIGLKHKFNERYRNDGYSTTLKGCYTCLLDLDLGLKTITYASANVQGRKKQIRGIRMSIEDFTRILTNEREVH